jgi:superfamily II DNA or RNA helicase
MTDGILIAGLAKLHSWRERDSVAFLKMAAKVRLVIMDEAHQAIAPTYREVIQGLCGAGGEGALLGLTATPGRSWNDVAADEALSEFFAGSKVVLEIGNEPNPVKYLLDNGYLARPSFQQIEYSPEIRPSAGELKKLARLDDYSSETLDKMAADTARNLAILDSAKALVARGHTRIILFAVSVEHAQDMASGLAAHGILAAVVSGETSGNKRASILKSFKSPVSRPQVLCNFGVLTTGFDAPKTSAAIIARPTKSLVLYSQMVGRATRGPKAGGNDSCEILTVHDPAYPGFGDIAEAFFNWEDVWNDH